MAGKLVIIGGVAGGTSAAGRARRTDPELEITIFEKGSFVSYGACDQPYVLAGLVPSWKNLLVRSPEEFKKKQNINIETRSEVTSIDPGKKTVVVRSTVNGEEKVVNWDSLIYAAGARPIKLDIPGADLPNVYSLKSLESARELLHFLIENKPKRAVIIGAGFVGLEVAEAFHARGISVTMINRRRLPGGPLDAEFGELIGEELADRGVEHIPEVVAEKIVEGPDGLASAVISGGKKYEADLVLSAIGVEPVVEPANSAGVALGPTGAIAVDEKMKTNLENIYAAGDCCESTSRIGGRKIYTPLGDVANKQGWTAGENAAGGDARYPGSLHSRQLKVFDLEIGVTGLRESEAREQGLDIFSVVVDHFSRTHVQPGRRPIKIKLTVEVGSRRLLGAQIAGADGAATRINTLATALAGRLTVEELADIDFGYAPPFSPVIDPILLAARVAVKK